MRTINQEIKLYKFKELKLDIDMKHLRVKETIISLMNLDKWDLISKFFNDNNIEFDKDRNIYINGKRLK